MASAEVRDKQALQFKNTVSVIKMIAYSMHPWSWGRHSVLGHSGSHSNVAVARGSLEGLPLGCRQRRGLEQVVLRDASDVSWHLDGEVADLGIAS